MAWRASTRARAFAQAEEVDFAEAFALPMVLPHQGWGLRDVIERTCAEQGVSMQVAMEADNLPVTKRLVAAGLGYTIATQGSVQEEVARAQLRFLAIRSPAIVWRMHASTLKGDALTLAQKAMLQELQHCVRDSAGEGTQTAASP